MKNNTLCALITAKVFEFLYNVALTALMIPAIYQITLSDKNVQDACLGLTITCTVLMVVHCLYNTLLWNCRFKCKTNCFCMGKCIFDFFNKAILSCWLKPLCWENLSKQNKQIWLKWLTIPILFIITFGVICLQNAENPKAMQDTHGYLLRIRPEIVLALFAG